MTEMNITMDEFAQDLQIGGSIKMHTYSSK